MASGDTKTNQYLDIAANGTRADLPSDTCCETRSQTLIRGVAERIMDVEDEVERLENNPDVADIVATYADLQAYDTSQLTDKDVIRVLQDETHDGDSTYYRWSTETQSWTYIGESKQYTDFVGTDGTAAGESGLVPAPATTDAGKYLKADGTWDEVQAGPTVVQTTGTSTTDVMSQAAASQMIYPAGQETNKARIYIKGRSNSPAGASVVSIGSPSEGVNQGVYIGTVEISPTGAYNIVIGDGYFNEKATVTSGHFRGIAIGGKTTVSNDSSIALGYQSKTSRTGELSIGGGTGTSYNTRYIANVTDPTDPQDAATKNYVDTIVGNIETALHTINNGGGQS